MVIFSSIYGAIAFIVFAFFTLPVFQDWSDYSKSEVLKCILFAVCVGLLWPVVMVLLIALTGCGAYYSWKERKDGSDDED